MQPVTQASYIRDWTVDGTLDQLIAEANIFFGDEQAFYIALPTDEAKRDLLATQFTFALHGIPEPEITLASGHKLFVAADADSIREKALVLTAADRRTIRALAILHASCGGQVRIDPYTKKQTTCPQATMLTFFVHDKQALAADDQEEVAKWVRAEAHRYNHQVQQQAQMSDSSLIHTIQVEVKQLRRQ